MIFVKSCKFPLCLFLHKMNFEIVFDDHPVRKQALLNCNNIEFTELPNYIFPDGLTHDLLIIQFKENKPSSTNKYQFNTVEILRFSKGLTHDFGQKLEISSKFVFGQNEPWDNV